MDSTMQDGPLSLATLLEHAASVHSAASVATWTGGGTKRMAYGELGAESARLANALRGLGISKGDRVATFMWNNNEHMVAYGAIPAMGAVLHTLNIRLTPQQLTFIANHAEDKVVILDGSLCSLFGEYLPSLTTVRHVIVANGDPGALDVPTGVRVHAYADLLASQPDTFNWPRVDERSAAAMCYTSGTTGDPKGVVYSHRSIWLHSMQVVSTNGMALSQADKALLIVPQFHAMSWGLPYAALMIGASLVMPDRFLQPAAIAQILATERPSFAAAVPTIWSGLLAHLESHPQDLTHLRDVVVGGSAVPPSLMRAFQERHGVRILQAWGMTETSPLASIARAPAGVDGEMEWSYRYTQGRFPAGVEARLVGDDGPVHSDGESLGEIEVRGPWVTASYFSPGAESVGCESFNDGWLRTGDIGKISHDGYLTLVDRSKDVIKSGGEWISSVELENAVMAHPSIAEAAVIAVPDEKWDERPMVAAVLRPEQSVTAADLREFLVDKIAKWQLPERWTFISEVPKTSVGKFDKKELRAQYQSGTLDIQRTD